MARLTPEDNLPDMPSPNGKGPDAAGEEVLRVVSPARTARVQRQAFRVPAFKIVRWERRPEGARRLQPPP